MSRREAGNADYQIVFGVDHTPMGCFFQIYESIVKDDEQPQIRFDELYGLTVNEPKTLERNSKLDRVIRTLRDNNDYIRNEEILIAIGKALGLDIEKDVFELWD